MAEPTTSTAGVAWAVAAGTLGAFMAAIGVTWAAVFWALCGTLFASPVAASVGRFRAIAMFPASVLLAAKVGGLVALRYFDGNGDMAGGLAAVSGIILHPTISALVKHWPEFIGRKLGMMGANQPTKDAQQ